MCLLFVLSAEQSKKIYVFNNIFWGTGELFRQIIHYLEKMKAYVISLWSLWLFKPNLVCLLFSYHALIDVISYSDRLILNLLIVRISLFFVQQRRRRSIEEDTVPPLPDDPSVTICPVCEKSWDAHSKLVVHYRVHTGRRVISIKNISILIIVLIKPTPRRTTVPMSALFSALHTEK